MKINKFCIYFLILAGVILFISNVKADSVKIYTSVIPNTSYLSVGSGSRVLNFETDNVYYNASELPRYFLLTFCTDSQRISTYSINSSGSNPTLDTVVFYKTDYSCSFPGSSYTGGKILYVYGTYNLAYNCGATGTNCTQMGSLTMSVPNQSSWTLYSYQNSIEEISIDYASGTIISQNSSIMSYQQQIINNQSANTQNIINNQNTNTQNIINNQNTNAQQAHTDSQNTQNTIKDDAVDNPNSSINTIKNSLASNGVITSLVVLPVTLYQAILNSVNGTCSTFSLGSLYGTNLTIPCINLSNYLGTTLWGSIDVIISGIFIYMISRKMVKVFHQLSSLKEGDVLDG